MYRTILMMLTAAVLAVGAGGCGNAAPRQGAQAAAPGTSPTRSWPAVASASAKAKHSPGAALLRTLVEPDDAIGPVYRLITEAHSSVELTMFKLADLTAESDLAADAARGVDVRVILDQHADRASNQHAYDYLAANGVHVRWGPAGTIYHQKTLTVDRDTSVVMTLNMVTADYPGYRDFAVIDTNRADVAAILATFNADFAGRAITPPDGTNLVWSPTNAQGSVLSVINGAARTLAVAAEKMHDRAVTGALAAAARRGVDVTITMTADREWDHTLTELAQAGAHIRLYPDNGGALYIHTKAIVADAGLPSQRVLVGSQNLSVASLGHNRELGILTRDPAVVATIDATIAKDYNRAAPYAPATASRPARASGSGAWCAATAIIYIGADDENNVYVHSNQPYQNATAVADGYSHSYQTDGSGYALIYLNGPQPGAPITVTVGGATCTTSD